MCSCKIPSVCDRDSILGLSPAAYQGLHSLEAESETWLSAPECGQPRGSLTTLTQCPPPHPHHNHLTPWWRQSVRLENCSRVWTCIGTPQVACLKPFRKQSQLGKKDGSCLQQLSQTSLSSRALGTMLKVLVRVHISRSPFPPVCGQCCWSRAHTQRYKNLKSQSFFTWYIGVLRRCLIKARCCPNCLADRFFFLRHISKGWLVTFFF